MSRAFQQFWELALDEIRARFHRAFGERQSGLPRHPDTDVVEMAHVEALDFLGRAPQVVAQASAVAREQGPKTLCRKALRELDGQERLASTGRTRHGRTLAMGQEAQDPGLIARQLDDLPVLLAEPDGERRSDLHPESQGRGEGVHPLRAESSSLPAPEPHDLGNPLGQPLQIVSIDGHFWRRGWMGPLVVDAVGEGHRVPVGRLPPFPAGLCREDLDERVHLVGRLVERVLVEEVPARASGLAPPSGVRVVGKRASFGLHD